MTTHVVVIGAGIVGLAAARELALRGARVTVVERHVAGAGTSSRGEGNILVSDKEIPAEARLALRSIELWRAFAEASPEPFEFEPKGGIITASSPAQLDLLAAQADRQSALGIESAVLDRDALRDMEPLTAPSLVGGISFPQDAQVMPIHAVRALRRAALDLGVVERVGTSVVGLSRLTAGPAVELADGTRIDADAVVLAAGPWSGELATRLGGVAPVFPRRGLLLVTEPLPAGTVRHKVYDGRYVEAVASDDGAAQVAPVIESTPSGTVLIGSTREAVGWDTQQRWDLVGELSRNAAALFPSLGRARIIRTYQGFRPATPDHLPLIGPDARVEGLFHCSGHEGAGIGLAMGSAELLADVVLDGRTDEAFDPRRLAELDPRRLTEPDPRRLTDTAAREADPVPGPTPFVLSPSSCSAAPSLLGTDPDEPGGSTVAAAMLANGQQVLRRTRFGDDPRGVFCGIGHCHDCVMTRNDGVSVRACLEPAAGRAVEEHHALAGGQGPEPAGAVVMDVDVVVLGAGPGGLAAAATVRGNGLSVGIVDRYRAAGGQIGRQRAGVAAPSGPWAELIGDGTRGVQHLTAAQVVAVQQVAGSATRRFQVMVAVDDELQLVLADHVVLATGAREVVRPFPGWTLPGVVTAGAAQAMVKQEGRSPWDRIVLAGTGPLLLAVASALRSAGATPLLTLESQPLRRLAVGGLPVGLGHPGKLADLARLTGGRPPRFGWRVVEAVEAASVASADSGAIGQVVMRAPSGRTARMDADALAVSDGLLPDVTLAVQLGCDLVTRPGTAGPAVVVDDDQSTSVPGVWAAGELTGVGGADKAVAEGRLAGAAILASTIGPAVPSGLRRTVRRWDGFRDALARLYPWDDDWAVGLPDEVQVCRCEEVPAGRVRRAIADGATTARAVKGLTRCGMGRCQGGVCGPLVSSMVRAAGHPSPGDLESRPVAQPVLVDQLARLVTDA